MDSLPTYLSAIVGDEFHPTFPHIAGDVKQVKSLSDMTLNLRAPISGSSLMDVHSSSGNR